MAEIIRPISDKMKQSIAEKLNNPSTTITSYTKLKALLKQELKKEINYNTLYCRRKHKSKLKVSRKSHYKKDPNAETFFKKPQIKI